MSGSGFVEKRMIAARVFVSTPVLVPACVDQHGLVAHVDSVENTSIDLLIFAMHDNAIEVRDRIEIEAGEILATRVAVERTVEIRAGVRDHLDLADVELGAGRVTRSGF